MTRAVVPLMLDDGTNVNGAILASDGGNSRPFRLCASAVTTGRSQEAQRPLS